ncbi:hypothetical protein M434DRAFT_390302, partial [Hypoxylon sp. CO27-5]
MPWKSIKPRTRISGHPLSQKGIRWVKSRLDHCFKHHACSNGLNKLLPARILSFKRSHEGEISIKLVEKPNESGRYAVLSHCWGSQLSFTTMTNNLSDMMQGIPWTELPRTFQDAIRYCLELGIFYLWIDALCILQDDKNDWQIESAKMADIYQNSYISLAATSSDSTTTGCFPKHAPPTNLSIRNNPLLSRGWVFQERVLAPRILHFCNQELVWECGEQTCFECGTLTKDGDRLPALSGLAERMAPFLGKYLTGLWDKSLLRDLTW